MLEAYLVHSVSVNNWTDEYVASIYLTERNDANEFEDDFHEFDNSIGQTDSILGCNFTGDGSQRF